MAKEEQDTLNSQTSNSSILIRSRSVLGDICECMRPYLKWVARQQTQRLPNCKVDESDIVQTGFYKAYERFDQFEGRTLSQWRAWLVQIVRNHAKDVLRYWTQERRTMKNEEHGSHLMRGLVDPSMESPSQALADEERRQLFDIALASLSIQDQQLVRWKLLENRSYKEIAERLSISEPTAKRRCEAAQEALFKILTELEG